MSSAGNEGSALAGRLSKAIDSFALTDFDADRSPVEPSKAYMSPARRRRRGFSSADFDGNAVLTLIDEEGALRWNYQSPLVHTGSRRARRRASQPIGATIVKEISFRETPPNQVGAALEELDRKLTPNPGLRRLKDGKFVPATGISVAGRTLLLVHGTFSKSEMFHDELSSLPQGQDFLRRAAKHYREILAFEHPTLSVSPWINALDLELALEKVTGTIDVVCHSRGGLVVAWWLRNARRSVGRVVFVGSPLEGTSLASPASLRSALDGMANVFKGLEVAGMAASTVVPFVGVVAGLARILGGILRIGAHTPLADAAVAIVPGLAAQSRVGNNSELDRLNRAAWISTPDVYAVLSNFKPSDGDARWWQVWKLLSTERVLNWGAERIFNAENDLVVDTQSMTRLCGVSLDAGKLHDFKTSSSVHHCNYFSQPETIALLNRALAI